MTFHVPLSPSSMLLCSGAACFPPSSNYPKHALPANQPTKSSPEKVPSRPGLSPGAEIGWREEKGRRQKLGNTFATFFSLLFMYFQSGCNYLYGKKN